MCAKRSLPYFHIPFGIFEFFFFTKPILAGVNKRYIRDFNLTILISVEFDEISQLFWWNLSVNQQWSIQNYHYIIYSKILSTMQSFMVRVLNHW